MRHLTSRAGRSALLTYAVALALAGLASHAVAAAEGATAAGEDPPPADLGSVEVRGNLLDRLQRTGRLADVIQKTELISGEQIQSKQAGNLAEAIDAEPGIRVSNECSMCGIKRVMINGLKGEHTTLLVDGVPAHSVVSSYYGFDAVTTAGISEIEIARGSGASMTVPEAIGGSINLVTRRPRASGALLDVSGGELGYWRGTGVFEFLSESGDSWAVAALQADSQDQFDGDDNGVTETPSLSNRSGFVKFSSDLNPRTNIEGRLGFYRSDVLGGPAGVSRSAGEAGFDGEGSLPLDLFEGGDVRGRFTGAPWETMEAVDTEREEFMLRATRELSDQTSMQVTGSYISHGQDSFYEGFDYVNEDDILYGDLRFTRTAGDNHLLTFGADLRDERMRSESDALREIQIGDPTIFGDSFDYRAGGLFLQDDWLITPDVELSLAVRVDKITADFIENPDADKIDETLIVPRAHLRWSHSYALTSRMSAGVGYRAPLAFYETDHGILDNGFSVDVDALEESFSVGYALSYDDGPWSVTGSAAWTSVDNLAYLDFDGPRPVLRNSPDGAEVSALDIAASYELSPGLTVGLTAEQFLYSSGYKETFSIAPPEQRLLLTLDFDRGPFSMFASLGWTGSIDLEDYGYGNRFNVFNDANGDGAVDPGELQAPKQTNAPSWFTLDLQVEYQINDALSIYAGGLNLTDYNQAADEDTPLFWDEDGGYDVGHIFAPLRGRTLYAGFRYGFGGRKARG